MSNSTQQNRPAPQVTLDNYHELAHVTEAPTSPELLQRLRDSSTRINTVLLDAVRLGEVFDQIKKHVFYGKEIVSADALTALRGGGRWKIWQVLDNNPEAVSRFEQMVCPLHAIFGIMTELAELIGPFHKYIETGEQIDTINVIEELGDSEWYHGILCNWMHITLREVLQRNINKLIAGRHGYKFDSVGVLEQNRDLTRERQILEAGDVAEMPEGIATVQGHLDMPQETMGEIRQRLVEGNSDDGTPTK